MSGLYKTTVRRAPIMTLPESDRTGGSAMKRTTLALATFAVLAAAVAAAAQPQRRPMQIKRITPLLYVDAIEPSLPFWERLGFTRDAEVPHGDRLGFVILKHGAAEIMYQTRASVADDLPVLENTPMGGSLLFIEVDDLAFVERNLGDTPLVAPKRTTFYGATEIIVREPAGNIVTFAQFQ